MNLRRAAEDLARAAPHDLLPRLLAHAARPGVQAGALVQTGDIWAWAASEALPGPELAAAHSASTWAARAAQVAQSRQAAFEPGDASSSAWAALPLATDPGAPVTAVLALVYAPGHAPDAAEQEALRILAALGGLAQRAEEVRQGERRRAQRLLEVSPIGIAAGTPDGQLVEANDAYLNLLGYTRAEFEAGQVDWLALTPEPDRAADAAAFERAFKTGQSGWYEKTMLTRGGEPIPVEVCLLRSHEHDQLLAVGYVRDLRERRLAEGQRRGQTDALAAELSRTEGALARLAEQLHAQNTELEARTAVLEGFAALTQDLTRHTDLYALIRRAQQFTLGLLPQGFAVYSEPEAELWRLRAQVGDLGSPEAQRALDGGLSFLDTPNLLIPWQTLQPYYQEGGQTEAAAPLQTTATLPVLVSGRPRGIFAIGLHHAQPWTPAHRVVLESVAQSLGVALEHVEQAQELQRHAAALEDSNAQLKARTRALEAFADLTRDLTLHSEPQALTQRTQQVLVSLLPHSVSTYHEPVGGEWHLRSHAGEFRDPGLLPLVGRLPQGGAMNLDQAYATQTPQFQSRYDVRAAPSAQEHLSAIRASAAVPVRVGGQVRGVLGVGRQETYTWTEADRQLLATVVYSLQLALERAEQAQTLHRRTQELERSNRELEQFAYVASHDLQEPLRTITSFAELLSRRFNTQADPKIDRYVQHITEGTARMQQLIQDLLTFARVTAPRQPPERLHPADLIGQVRDDLRSQIEQAGAALEVGDLPPVIASATQLRQLLQNLIGNALKFCVPGRAPVVQVSAQREGDWVRLCVQDNGIGIDPAYHERIFTVFQRLHGREQYLGNGIGLSVARRIVEGHGGQMGVESAPGQGSTFWFTLPAG